jgi:hypothetical protein
MTGKEVFNEVIEIFGEHFTPGLQKLALIQELIPDDENEGPEVIQGLQKSLKASSEKGLNEILVDVLGELDIFILMMECLQVQIAREDKEAPETEPSHED